MKYKLWRESEARWIDDGWLITPDGDVVWEVVEKAINVVGEPGVIKVKSKPVDE